MARQVNYKAMDWTEYHDTAETHALLNAWSRRFPSLTNLYSIGETLQGTPLMMLEITNKDTGDASEKPGYYYDGNIHAGELTGAEVALNFAWHLLVNYGRDSRITELLDTRTLYIRPKFNPDGADIAQATPEPSLRSTPRPYDEDADGLLDEDGATDLDGDGFVTRMRVPNEAGQWKKSSEDSRLMIRRADGDDPGAQYFDMYSEGADDDGDGAFNEDGIGGIDMNRNFPRNWGLEFEQRGAGPFPLSEPETRATIEFLSAHRNVTGVFHGHTAGGFLYRLPSTTAWDEFDASDQDLIIELANEYNVTTGQPVVPSYTDPRVHRYGTLISWSYWDFGVPATVPEFWGGAGRDYDEDGEISNLEQLKWNDDELNGAGFSEWTPYQHPQLGDVEIGGWRRRFVFQNPPPHLLKDEIEQYVPWMIWLAEISPKIIIEDIVVTPLSQGGQSKIHIRVANTGFLPTNITQRALDAEIAVPVRIFVELEDAELLDGTARTDIGHLAGSRDNSDTATFGTADYVIRVTGPKPVIRFTIVSEKGGVARKHISL